MNKILIVDDLPQNLYMLEILLQTNGYEVHQATNGIEALELAHKDPPEMIISDILMPGMDGFSLCRAWKTDEDLKDIPFVFYTATYIDPKDEKLALELGAERFIVKPMEPDAFLAILKEVIQQQESKEHVVKQQTIEQSEDFFKEYNEALIRKLEDKMLDLQRSNKRLNSLYKVSCEILSVKSQAELVHTILRAIVESTGYQQTNYFVLDETQNKLVLLDLVGYSEASISELKGKLSFNFGDPKGIAGMVAQTQKLINIPDTTKEVNWIPIDPLIKSAFFTPVLFGKKLFGVIGLFSSKPNDFSPEDEHDIVTLANSLAMAFENNSNQEKVMKQLERISALHNIDMAINSSLDLHNTLNIFLKHVTTQLKADAVDILLCHQNESGCIFAASRGFINEKPQNIHTSLENNLAKKVLLDRRMVHLQKVTSDMLSAEFQKIWMDEGFTTYIGIPLIAKGEVVGVLEIYHRKPSDPDPEWLDYFETLAGQAAIAIDKGTIFEGLQRSNMELSLAYDATIKGWSRALDMRDQETEGHTQRVTEMTIRLAEAIGIKDEAILQIRRGALLHDIGKLGVPDAVLLKPGALSDEEWVIMRRHPQSAYEMLHPIDYLHKALDIPYCHHEKWDGTGYPRGLKGESIPLAARIFSVIDVYDALRSDRPYRKAWTEEKVIEYIREQSGSYFDPKIVELFLKMISKGLIA
jgi:response regulator RpfG family c-di-GMP phosphodiesterase